jgi:transposase
MESNSLLGLLLPKEIALHFNLINAKEEDSRIIFYLEEKNTVPPPLKAEEYESKGFFKEQRVQDFPIRGKEVYLKIRRRRWRHKVTKEEVKREWNSVTKGSKLTADLADFLKEYHRVTGR